MIYSENLDGDDSSNADEQKHIDKPITTSSIGESLDGSGS